MSQPSQSILLVDEAVLATRRKPISEKRLFKMLNGYNTKDEPTSAETRQLAYEVLWSRGFHFLQPEKKKKAKTKK